MKVIFLNLLKSLLGEDRYLHLKALVLRLVGRSHILPPIFVHLRTIKNKNGIEIGGPSPMFKDTFRIYQRVNSLDNVNFSSVTLWENELSHNSKFNFYENKPGIQFISEASDLGGISKKYDFLISSNCLEHVANPIKTVFEWKKVLKPGGFMFIVVPWKESNFDHRRSFTEFEHVLDDFNKNVGEDDMTHLDEILKLHDLSRDLPAGSLEEFKLRCLDNFNIRGMHHHVFSIELLKQIISFCDLNHISSGKYGHDLFIYAQNT